MNSDINKNNKRIDVVDALRGFAIVSIMLLHNIEHFDFYYLPSNLPAWMSAVDSAVWQSLFFLFGGKSYAIFALLFGVTFFIQSFNQKSIGKDFRGRFAWRLLLLLFFGIINSAFYEGDILSIYAVIGFFLIPVARVKNKTLFWIALVLMLQPFEWIKFFVAVQNPDMRISDPVSWSYFGKAGEYITDNSIVKTWIGNLTNGKTAVLYWNWEKGRVFQTLSLFMFGILAGRKYLFVPSEANKNFWNKILIIASISFIVLYFVKINLGTWISSKAITRPLETIETSWTNMFFMLVLVSGFVLLFRTKTANRILHTLSSLGRMSLSNYVMQSIIGSFIYYGFGLGLYRYTGSTYCLIIGISLAVFQGYLSTWWMKKHKRGPLEAIWHKATWISYRKFYLNRA